MMTMVVGARQRLDADASAAPTCRPSRHPRRPGRPRSTCTREKRSRVMIWPNEAVPRTRSAMPGVRGSVVIAARFGCSSERSIRITRASSRERRASATAVSVVPMPGGRADDGDLAAGLARLAQRARHLGDGQASSAGGAPRLARPRLRGRSFTGSIGSCDDGAASSAASPPAPAPLRGRAPAGVSDRRDGAPARPPGSATGTGAASSGAIDVAGEKLAGRDEAGRDEQRRERRDQHDRQLLREVRGVRHQRARDDARVGRHRADAVARASPRDTWRDRIRAGRAAPSPRRSSARSCTSCLVGRGRLLLELVEAARQLLDARAGDASRRSPASARAAAASSRIWRSRSAICAFSSLMRGWSSSSVEDCSASCARSVTRCSLSRRISSELITSEDSSGPPRLSMSRMKRAFDSSSAFCERAAARSRFNSPSVWFDSVVLLVPMNRLVLERNSSTLASASATRLRMHVDLAGEPAAGGAGLVLARGLLHHQIVVGDRVGDLARQAPDRPTGIRSRSRATCRPGTQSAARNRLRARAPPASC